MATQSLFEALTRLRGALADLSFPLVLPDTHEYSRQIKAVTGQLNNYILPRLKDIDAPILCVVGGSTGAGKSTLVNSVLGHRVTRPGVIRPTTKSPVLVCHPYDASWFETTRVLPRLARTTEPSHDVNTVQLVSSTVIPEGLALLDAPDIDSIDSDNRNLASELLLAADLWLFCTSAARYADALPWEYLVDASERSMAVGVVCNRIPPSAMRDVPRHLATMMTERGLADSPLFVVPETVTDADGILPEKTVAPIRRWLAGIAHDQQSRRAVVMSSLSGAIAAVSDQSLRIADHVDEQSAAWQGLRKDAVSHFDDAIRTVKLQTSDGTMLRGEVLQRWEDFAGTSQFTRALNEKVSRLRDRFASLFSSAPVEGAQMRSAVESGLHTLIREAGMSACEHTVGSWQAHPAGRQILESISDDLAHTDDEFDRGVPDLVRNWQADVLDLVSAKGQTKRNQARIAALGVNGIGAALMVIVFASTGGLTGAEIGIAGGTSVVAQKLLESLFGDDAVRNLSRRAKELLDARIDDLFATQLSRFTEVLDRISLPIDLGDQIRDAVAEVTAGLAGSEFTSVEAKLAVMDAPSDRTRGDADV